MKLEVREGKFLAKERLKDVAKMVVDLVCGEAGYRLREEGGCCLVGPHGIAFQIFSTLDPDENRVMIRVLNDGSIDLIVPAPGGAFSARSNTVPVWAEEALSAARDDEELSLMAAITFGQVPLRLAAKLFRMPLDELKGHILSARGAFVGSQGVLEQSVTKVNLDPDESTIDIRGLAAWLLLTD